MSLRLTILVLVSFALAGSFALFSVAATRYPLGAVAVAGAVLVAVILLLLERLVLAPLTRLSSRVQHVTASGDLSSRIAADGRGELAALAAAINGMLQALEVSQRQRREAEVELAGANRQREEFVSLIAHELRHPIAAMALMAETLAETPGLGESERFAR